MIATIVCVYLYEDVTLKRINQGTKQGCLELRDRVNLTFSNIKTVKAFGKELHEYDDFISHFNQIQDRNRKLVNYY